MAERNYASELAAVQSAPPPTNPDDYSSWLNTLAGLATFAVNPGRFGMKVASGPTAQSIGELTQQANRAMPWGGNDPRAIGIDPQQGSIDPNVMVPFATEVAGYAGTGGMAAPKPAGSVGTFGGRLAKTADQAALAKAEQMAAQGVDRGVIWQETGWFQGKDTKWRYEIPDDKSVWMGVDRGGTWQAAGGGKITPTSGFVGGDRPLLKHDALLDAYPDMTRTRVESGIPGGGFDTFGQYDPRTDTVRLASVRGDKSTALHEAQHAIQHREGFTGGGGSTSRDIDSIDWEKISPAINKYDIDTDMLPDTDAIKFLDALRKEIVKKTGGSVPEEVPIIMERLRIISDVPTEYKLNPGEVEARNVQTRQGMTPEQRRARPPWETQDVPDHAQIIRMRAEGPQARIDVPPIPTRLREAYEAKAAQMELDPKKRIQPDPNRRPLVDTDYHRPPATPTFEPTTTPYPRMPEGMEMNYPENNRVRVLIDNKEDIAQGIARKIAQAGQIGANTQFFYHSNGPLYRVAEAAGLSPDEAGQWVRDFAQHVGATSPRTETLPNTLNATSAMAKQAAGIPHRQIVGPGSGGISEKGYPMMTGPKRPGQGAGPHGTLLDTIQSGQPIDMMVNTKPANFAPNVAGDLSRVTADTHAIRGALLTWNELRPGGVPAEWLKKEYRAGYKKDPSILKPNMINDTLASATTKKYDYGQVEYGPVADVYHRVAEILGVSPAEAQSMSWFGLGGQTNLGSELKTLSEIFDERLSVTAQVLGITPEEAARRVFRREIPLLQAGVPIPSQGNEKEKR